MKTNTILTEIVTAVKANTPAIWINTSEEDRVIQEILASFGHGTTDGFFYQDPPGATSKVQAYVWSVTQGMVDLTKKNSYDEMAMNEPDRETSDIDSVLNTIIRVNPKKGKKICLLFLRSSHEIMQRDMLARRKFMDVRSRLYHIVDPDMEHVHTTIFFLGNSSEIPSEITNLVKYYDYPYATQEDLTQRINEVLNELLSREDVVEKADGKKYDSEGERLTHTPEEIAEVAAAMTGISFPEISDAINLSMTTEHCLSANRIMTVKDEVLKRSDILELEHCADTMADVGGLDLMKEYLRFKELSRTPFGKACGISQPNGFLCLGIQGGGKSLTARVTASFFGLPLIRLDVGRIFAGLVGQSESRMRDMIKQIESIRNAVLFIDEIEKGFSGTASSNASDSGTTSRIFATFITWLNDKRKPGHPGNGIMVIGTANSIDQLPPEFLRRGRFDEIFFVDLPTKSEATDILRIHVRRQNLPVVDDINYDMLAGITYNLRDKNFLYSGAELEQAVIDSRAEAVNRVYKGDASKIDRNSIPSNFRITTEDIASAIRKTVPLSVTMEEPLKKLRKFGKERCRPASSDADADTTREVADASAANIQI